MIRTCASIFCHAAKAAYLKRVETDTAILFLDALRGLGVFCDTLFQQIVFELKDGPLKNSINNTMGIHSRKFGKEMKRLKEQFMQSMDATGIKHTVIIFACCYVHLLFFDNEIYEYMIRVRCAYPRQKTQNRQ